MYKNISLNNSKTSTLCYVNMLSKPQLRWICRQFSMRNLLSSKLSLVLC